MKEADKIYRQRYDSFLKQIAKTLEDHIASYFDGMASIDRISARAKEPERFVEKAQRTDEEGRLKYEKPLTEIQDILGARIVV